MVADGRRSDELRPLELQVDYLEQPQGSALISLGRTRLAPCRSRLGLLAERRGAADDAEYGLLPASTGERTAREAWAARRDAPLRSSV